MVFIWARIERGPEVCPVSSRSTGRAAGRRSNCKRYPDVPASPRHPCAEAQQHGSPASRYVCNAASGALQPCELCTLAFWVMSCWLAGWMDG